MSISTSELDRLQSAYKTAVDQWRAAIDHEEALASGIHSEAAIDTWEAAHFAEEKTRLEARAAKGAYEEALRKEFFNF
jgi:cyclopropane fatty-acyl-phospholipid synthase-like methyltransferase